MLRVHSWLTWLQLRASQVAWIRKSLPLVLSESLGSVSAAHEANDPSHYKHKATVDDVLHGCHFSLFFLFFIQISCHYYNICIQHLVSICVMCGEDGDCSSCLPRSPTPFCFCISMVSIQNFDRADQKKNDNAEASNLSWEDNAEETTGT